MHFSRETESRALTFRKTPTFAGARIATRLDLINRIAPFSRGGLCMPYDFYQRTNFPFVVVCVCLPYILCYAVVFRMSIGSRISERKLAIYFPNHRTLPSCVCLKNTPTTQKTIWNVTANNITLTMRARALSLSE